MSKPFALFSSASRSAAWHERAGAWGRAGHLSVGTSPPSARPGVSRPRVGCTAAGKLVLAGTQGLDPPGGCKPQAKAEKGKSSYFNPFYTVKTADLSPRRPLFN